MPRDRSAAAGSALALAVLPCVLLLAAGAVGARVVGVELEDLVREPTRVGKVPWYAGGLAAATVMLWSGAAALALGTWTAGRPWPAGDPRGALLAGLGVLTLALAVDDQYLVHEELLPRLGAPEGLVVLGYPLVLGALLLRARRWLAPRADTAVLVLALLALGGSFGLDLVLGVLPERVTPADSPTTYVEDGLKLVGAGLWLRYVLLLVRAPAAARSSAS